MTPELVLADMVRRWVGDVLPDDPAAAERAVVIALRLYESGASVAEACEAVRRHVGAWSRHPSRHRAPALRRAS
jgi:hypothetical protein